MGSEMCIRDRACDGTRNLSCLNAVLGNLDKHHTKHTREFKKLGPQLQRKRHIKTELCVKLSLLRLFHVYHVVENRRTALSLAWYEWFSCKGKE